MKRQAAILSAILVLALSSCDSVKVDVDPITVDVPGDDITNFCYYDGKKYTSGAWIVIEQQAMEQSGHNAFFTCTTSDGKMNWTQQ